MTDQQIKKRILLRLSNRVITIDELGTLISITHNKYKAGKSISDLIEWHSYREMEKRLSTSVFSEIEGSYPIGFRKYCIYGEYQNTKLFIEFAKKLIKIGNKRGDITNPEFYGQPDPGFKILLEKIFMFFFDTIKH